MSKFIARLKQVSQPTPRPMGFGFAKSDTERLKIQLAVRLSAVAASLGSQLSAADAVILPSSKRGLADILWGLWAKKGDAEEINQAATANADFVVLSSTGSASLPDKKLGKILQLDAGIGDVLLRTVNELPVDAVLVNEDKENIKNLTWQRLMVMQRFTAFLNKPVMATVPLDVTVIDLKLIWETGVSGVIVDVSNEAEIESVKNLRQIIGELPFPVRKKREELSAVLPHVSGQIEEEPDEDGDDDDDDE